MIAWRRFAHRSCRRFGVELIVMVVLARRRPLRRTRSPRYAHPLRVTDDPHDALASSHGRVDSGASKRKSVTTAGSSVTSTRASSDAGIVASSTAGAKRPRKLVQK